ncbi:MAG: ribosome maturation factor RimM [Sulfurimonas sp.]|nr:ribosome maturation factor RimM [Sulfurimonas sp.]
MKQSDLLHIAIIGKTVGIKGDMKLHLYTDFPEQFKNNSSFFINPNERLTLREVNLDRGLIKIDGVFTPEDAKKFTNKKLYATMEETRKNCHLKEGEFFWFDLVGCKIIEDSISLGIVTDIDRINSLNYLKINTDEKLIKSGCAKTFLLPHNEPFIIKTDIENKIITTNAAMDILEAS